MRALRRKRAKEAQYNTNSKRPKKVKGRFLVEDAADK